MKFIKKLLIVCILSIPIYWYATVSPPPNTSGFWLTYWIYDPHNILTQLICNDWYNCWFGWSNYINGTWATPSQYITNVWSWFGVTPTFAIYEPYFFPDWFYSVTSNIYTLYINNPYKYCLYDISWVWEYHMDGNYVISDNNDLYFIYSPLWFCAWTYNWMTLVQSNNYSSPWLAIQPWIIFWNTTTDSGSLNIISWTWYIYQVDSSILFNISKIYNKINNERITDWTLNFQIYHYNGSGGLISQWATSFQLWVVDVWVKEKVSLRLAGNIPTDSNTTDYYHIDVYIIYNNGNEAYDFTNELWIDTRFFSTNAKNYIPIDPINNVNISDIVSDFDPDYNWDWEVSVTEWLRYVAELPWKIINKIYSYIKKLLELLEELFKNITFPTNNLFIIDTVEASGSGFTELLIKEVNTQITHSGSWLTNWQTVLGYYTNLLYYWLYFIVFLTWLWLILNLRYRR